MLYFYILYGSYGQSNVISEASSLPCKRTCTAAHHVAHVIRTVYTLPGCRTLQLSAWPCLSVEMAMYRPILPHVCRSSWRHAMSNPPFQIFFVRIMLQVDRNSLQWWGMSDLHLGGAIESGPWSCSHQYSAVDHCVINDDARPTVLPWSSRPWPHAAVACHPYLPHSLFQPFSLDVTCPLLRRQTHVAGLPADSCARSWQVESLVVLVRRRLIGASSACSIYSCVVLHRSRFIHFIVQLFSLSAGRWRHQK